MPEIGLFGSGGGASRERRPYLVCRSRESPFMWLTLAHALTPRTVYTMPKIVRFHQVGGPEVLKLEELPTRKPQKR
jgi:hypothetical protein